MFGNGINIDNNFIIFDNGFGLVIIEVLVDINMIIVELVDGNSILSVDMIILGEVVIDNGIDLNMIIFGVFVIDMILGVNIID